MYIHVSASFNYNDDEQRLYVVGLCGPMNVSNESVHTSQRKIKSKIRIGVLTAFIFPAVSDKELMFETRNQLIEIRRGGLRIVDRKTGLFYCSVVKYCKVS